MSTIRATNAASAAVSGTPTVVSEAGSAASLRSAIVADTARPRADGAAVRLRGWLASHPRVEQVARDAGVFALRAILAIVFFYHGGQKLFGLFGGHGLSGTAGWMASIGIPLPLLSATMAGSAEFFGGLALLAGLGVRIAAIPMLFTMLVAIATAHWGRFDASAGGMEYPLTLAVALLSLALIGGGRWTITRALQRRPRG